MMGMRVALSGDGARLAVNSMILTKWDETGDGRTVDDDTHREGKRRKGENEYSSWELVSTRTRETKPRKRGKKLIADPVRLALKC